MLTKSDQNNFILIIYSRLFVVLIIGWIDDTCLLEMDVFDWLHPSGNLTQVVKGYIDLGHLQRCDPCITTLLPSHWPVTT